MNPKKDFHFVLGSGIVPGDQAGYNYVAVSEINLPCPSLLKRDKSSGEKSP
jgi:hypothetical protein